MRTTKEVLSDHLNLSKTGTIEEDLKRNYSEDIILLATHGIYKGHQGLKKLMKMLNKELPDLFFEYKKILIEGEVAFLEWKGNSKKAEVKDGADSYVVRNGLIVAQTIHYTQSKKIILNRHSQENSNNEGKYYFISFSYKHPAPHSLGVSSGKLANNLPGKTMVH